MEDIKKEISFIEEKLAQLKEQSYQASTPVKQPGKERKDRDSGVGESGDFGQLQAKSPTHGKHEESKRNEESRYQSLHASPERADEQRDKDVYETDRAIPRNDHGPEPTASFELYEPEDFMQSEGPSFRQWPDDRDHALSHGVTKRRSRVRFASPPLYERPLTELPATRQLIKPATYDGSGPWQDYHAHFEACAEISGWRYYQKGLYFDCCFSSRKCTRYPRKFAKGIQARLPNFGEGA